MDTADVAESTNKYEEPNVRFCDVMVGERKNERPQIIDGASAEQEFKVETDKEGKNVFPTIVAMDDETKDVTVTYKQNGERKTISLGEYASQELKEARKRKQGAVPSKQVKPKSKPNDNVR